jgi:hemerythrin-like domain-containing protein
MPAADATAKPFLEPIPPELLAQPLDYIVAEHFRLRLVCNRLDAMAAEGRADPREAEEIATFLDRDLRLHVIDEEDDLFPLLRRRCRPEDEIGRALGGLAREHAADDHLGSRVIAALGRLGPNGRIDRDRDALAEFAAHQRSHIAFENAVVLPIARRRLTARDLRTLGARMASRRGIVSSEESGT